MEWLLILFILTVIGLILASVIKKIDKDREQIQKDLKDIELNRIKEQNKRDIWSAKNKRE